jgi:hypothetical protein
MLKIKADQKGKGKVPAHATKAYRRRRGLAPLLPNFSNEIYVYRKFFVTVTHKGHIMKRTFVSKEFLTSQTIIPKSFKLAFMRCTAFNINFLNILLKLKDP